MSVYQLQIRARNEWYGSRDLQREYATPEYYWWEKYQRVYCPECRANLMLLHPGRAG
ncbi:MAG: hypothetical protein U9Q81_23260 [Pseudomonadota bacterium]|nr:hypothetical protein [Pseudomonadota bacterium]